MKAQFIIVGMLLFLNVQIHSQKQLDIQGDPASHDTVAQIRVNYVGKGNVVGLSVYSNPDGMFSENGLAGYFFGGWRGVLGRSENGTGVIGQSTNGIGLKGESTNESGVMGISTDLTGVHGESTNGVGVYGLAVDQPGVSGFSTDGPGVLGESVTDYGVIGTSTNLYGVYGESTNSSGIYGLAVDQPGVSGFSTDGPGVLGESVTDYGVIGTSTNLYGVYGESDNSYGVYGRGDNLADFWAHNGTYGNSSSIRWKKNIRIIDDPLNKLLRLRGVYFDWDKNHGGGTSIGFIAEEVGEVLPEIVFYEENGIDAKGMDYSKITPLLVQAANAMRKEYQNKFDQQQSEIDVLRQEIEELKTIITFNKSEGTGQE